MYFYKKFSNQCSGPKCELLIVIFGPLAPDSGWGSGTGFRFFKKYDTASDFLTIRIRIAGFIITIRNNVESMQLQNRLLFFLTNIIFLALTIVFFIYYTVQEYEYTVHEEVVRVECTIGGVGLLGGGGHRGGGSTTYCSPPQVLRQVSLFTVSLRKLK